MRTLLLSLAIILVGLGLLTGQAVSSEESEMLTLQKQLKTISDNQTQILQELKIMREEMHIIKIRCSQ